MSDDADDPRARGDGPPPTAGFELAPEPGRAAPPPPPPRASGPASGARGPTGGRSLLATLRDNLEAIAFALVLALLLRHFAIEVFKIPTASMVPTLFGDDSDAHPDTPGDRVFVDKAAYLFRDPARWDVVVFRYPLDWSRNFIKRVVGRPGEALRIARGDVWTAARSTAREDELRPSRKPRRVREQLYVPIYPPVGPRASGRPDEWWRSAGSDGAAWRAVEHGRLVYDGASGDATVEPAWAALAYGWPIRDTDDAESDPRSPDGTSFRVPDVRWRGRVRAAGPAELEIEWKPGDGRRQVLRLASEGLAWPGARADSAILTTEGRFPLKERLVPGRDVDLELESVDGDVRAWVDGREVRVVPDEVRLAEAERLEAASGADQASSLTVSVRGAALEVRDVRVDRDLYYTSHVSDASYVPGRGETLRLGPEDFFVLGDNTRHSSDSRRWRATGVKLRDGTTILYEWQTSWRHVEGSKGRLKEVVDVEGVLRRWDADDEVDSAATSERVPFVRRDRIIGRAWYALVFWPLDRAWSRFRFIH